jgi:hypothetical protein
MEEKDLDQICDYMKHYISQNVAKPHKKGAEHLIKGIEKALRQYCAAMSEGYSSTNFSGDPEEHGSITFSGDPSVRVSEVGDVILVRSTVNTGSVTVFPDLTELVINTYIFEPGAKYENKLHSEFQGTDFNLQKAAAKHSYVKSRKEGVNLPKYLSIRKRKGIFGRFKRDYDVIVYATFSKVPTS